MLDGELAQHSASPASFPWLPALLALLITTATGVLAWGRYEPPPVVPASAPREVFSAERAYERLVDLLGDESPHPLGSPANDLVRDRLLGQLEELGLQPEENDYWILPNKWSSSVVLARNILAELPSSHPNLPAIMLACHYDSVAAGPGASDDGAAVAAFLEVAGILMAEAPLPRPVILLFTDGEELGLHGAYGFASYHPAADRVGMILNFEARGSSGGSLMFETSRDNGWMIRQAARGLRRPMSSSAYVEVYRHMPNSSDLAVFMDRGLAGINFAYIGRPKHYHTPLDNLAHLDQRSLQHHGDNALGMVRQLLGANWDQARPPKGDAVYTDILAAGIISWPAPWGPWIAGALLLVLSLAVSRLRTKCRWSAREFVHAVTGWLVANLIGITLGWLGAWGLLRADGTPSLWPAAMHFDVAVPCLCAAVGVILTLLYFRPDPALLFLVHGSALALAALILAVGLPGFSYQFLLPAAGAALAALFFLARCPGTTTLTIACLLVGMINAALMAPLLVRLPETLGVVFSAPAVAAVSAGLLLPLLPLLVRLRRHLLFRSALAVTLAAAACFYLALRTPAFTPDAPQQITLSYLEQEGDAHAQISLYTWEGHLPPALLEGLEKREEPNALYPLPGQAMVSAADGLTAPKAELLAWNAEGRQHAAKIRFTPSRRSQEILVGVEVEQGLKEISGLGKEIAVPSREIHGRKWLRFRGISEDGIEVELTWEGPAPLPLVLVGITTGLPDHLAELAEKRNSLPACTAHKGDVSIAVKEVTLQSPVF